MKTALITIIAATFLTATALGNQSVDKTKYIKQSDDKIISAEPVDNNAKPSLDDLVIDKDPTIETKDQDKQMTGPTETDSSTTETSTDAQSPTENDS